MKSAAYACLLAIVLGLLIVPVISYADDWYENLESSTNNYSAAQNVNRVVPPSGADATNGPNTQEQQVLSHEVIAADIQKEIERQIINTSQAVPRPVVAQQTVQVQTVSSECYPGPC